MVGSLRNQIRGKKSQHRGKSFEADFRAACRYVQIPCTRIPDGCRRIGFKKIIPVKSPFDFVISYQGKTALLDTKITVQNAFPNSQIELHQVAEMLEHQAQDILGGYVVCLSKIDKVIYIPTNVLYNNYKKKGSIDHETLEVITLGTSLTFNPKLIFEHKESKTI